MNKKLSIGIIVALVVVLALSFVFKKDKEPVVENKVPETVSIIYSNGETEVPATFDNTNSTVSFYHEALGDVTLESAISASGARYANADESLVLWEHQGEVTITKDGEDVFVGRIIEAPDYSNLSLVGTWNWEKAVSAEGEFIPKQKEEFTITFSDDGKVNGTTDCNGFFGEYQIEEYQGLSFSPLATTMMYCEGSEEAIFTGYLASSTSYTLNSPEELVITLQDSSTLHFSK